MKYLILAFVLSAGLQAQTLQTSTGGKAKLITYTGVTNIFTIQIDFRHCTFWFNLPNPGFMQAACYDQSRPTARKNEIVDFTNPNPAQDDFIVGDFSIGLTSITWKVGVDAANKRTYELVSRGPMDSTELRTNGVF